MWIAEYEEAVKRLEVDEVAPAPHLLERVAQVVSTLPKVFKQKQGYDWALDESNDWKMSRKEDSDVFVVAYRYGGGNEEFMKSL